MILSKRRCQITTYRLRRRITIVCIIVDHYTVLIIRAKGFVGQNSLIDVQGQSPFEE